MPTVNARIICVGSRLDARDTVGPRVFDRLADEPRPEGVEIVDGGLLGLDLLRAVDGVERVVFVDTIDDAPPGEVAVLEREVAARCCAGHFGHASSLAYLLNAMPYALEGAQPHTLLVGAHPDADEPTIARIAEKSLSLAGGAVR